MGDQLLATALHVVADCSVDPPAFAPNLRVTFAREGTGSDSKQLVVEQGVEVVNYSRDLDEDWALLRVPKSVAAPVFELSCEGRPGQPTQIHAFGETNIERIHGMLASVSKRQRSIPHMQVWTHNLGTTSPEELLECAGAPVMVRGCVTGLVVRGQRRGADLTVLEAAGNFLVTPARLLKLADGTPVFSPQPEVERARRLAVQHIERLIAGAEGFAHALCSALNIAVEHKKSPAAIAAERLLNDAWVDELLRALIVAQDKQSTPTPIVREILQIALPFCKDYARELKGVRNITKTGVPHVELPASSPLQAEAMLASLEHRPTNLHLRDNTIVANTAIHLQLHNPAIRSSESVFDTIVRWLEPYLGLNVPYSPHDALLAIANHIEEALSARRAISSPRHPPFYVVAPREALERLDLVAQHLPSLRIVTLGGSSEEFSEVLFNSYIKELLADHGHEVSRPESSGTQTAEHAHALFDELPEVRFRRAVREGFENGFAPLFGLVEDMHRAMHKVNDIADKLDQRGALEP